jgi:hypothetical protein
MERDELDGMRWGMNWGACTNSKEQGVLGSKERGKDGAAMKRSEGIYNGVGESFLRIQALHTAYFHSIISRLLGHKHKHKHSWATCVG